MMSASTSAIPQYHFSDIIVLNNDNNGEGTTLPRVITKDFVVCMIIAILVMVIALIVKLLWNIDGDNNGGDIRRNVGSATESSTLLSEEEPFFRCSSYGAIATGGDEENLLGFCSSSSDDLYNAKICVICYDHERNCFFVPCGHCISCIRCAHRIMSGEMKRCPICRTFINKVDYYLKQ